MVVIVLACFCSSALGLSNEDAFTRPMYTTPPKKTADNKALSEKEEAMIRKLVYRDGLGTTLDPFRQVVLNTDLVSLHKRKRLASVRLLLDVIKGGRPSDFRTAAAFVVGLEEGPVAALAFVDCDDDEVDEIPVGGKITFRIQTVRRIERILEKIEKK